MYMIMFAICVLFCIIEKRRFVENDEGNGMSLRNI